MAQILVVDDEVGIRELLSEILADEGHQVTLGTRDPKAEAVSALSWKGVSPDYSLGYTTRSPNGQQRRGFLRLSLLTLVSMRCAFVFIASFLSRRNQT